ncbi:MAG: hypothetical protein M1834_004642 [Cirrosporium novae-zelandiae]|nr:MAG: hypothetical protein M1834_004642 [Cirrosporium novae-zelandiae]
MQSKILVFILAALAFGSVIDIHFTSNDDLTLQSGGASSITRECYWDGTSPFCAGQCPSGYVACGKNSQGDGAECLTGFKMFCCKGSCTGLTAVKETPNDELRAASGDNVCGKNKFMCCPLGATKDEECICLDKKSEAPTISKNPHPLTDGNGEDDICKEGERICCPPGATKNSECRCAPKEKYLSLEL